MSNEVRYITTMDKLQAQCADRDGGWHCHYCFAPLDPPVRDDDYELLDRLPHRTPTLDHKKPRSRGGTWNASNLVLCCRSCNSRKQARYSYEEFYAMTAELRKGDRQ